MTDHLSGMGRRTVKTAFPTGVTLQELPPSGARLVRVEKRPILLIQKEGVVWAVSNRCPHEETPFGESGLSVSEKGEPVLICPLHGWTFNVLTGESSRNPGVCLKHYPVSVVDGSVLVTI